MAETDVHRDEMADLILALRRHFRAAPDVYVSGNLLLYYREGDPKKRRAPDVFVVKGVEKRRRRTYLLWEEGVPPTMVIEVTSAGTRRQDEVEKRALYARLGVASYFLYDPLGEYLDPALQGFRLTDPGVYEPVDPPFACDALDLGLRLDDDGRLQLADARSGAPIERLDTALDREIAARELAEELRLQAEQARARAEQALDRSERARRDLEQELARLRARTGPAD